MKGHIFWKMSTFLVNVEALACRSSGHGKTETPPIFTLCDSLEKKKELNMWHLLNRSSSSLDAAYIRNKSTTESLTSLSSSKILMISIFKSVSCHTAGGGGNTAMTLCPDQQQCLVILHHKKSLSAHRSKLASLLEKQPHLHVPQIVSFLVLMLYKILEYQCHLQLIL